MPALSTAAPAPQVCRDAICVQTAQTIKQDMNLNIDPCSDFYEYSCGGWIRDHELPRDRSMTGILSDIQYNNEQITYDIIHGTYDNFTRNVLDDAKPLLIEQQVDRSNFHLVQDYYNACMDEATLIELGPSPMYPSLAQLKKMTDLTDTLAFLFNKNIEPFFGTFVAPDGERPTVNVINIDQPGLGAPSTQYYQDKEIMAQYKSGLLALMESAVGTKVNKRSIEESKRINFALWTSTEIETIVNQYIEMETMLAGLLVKEEIHADPILNYNSLSLDNLQARYPFIDWRKFLQYILPKQMDPPDTLILGSLPYFDGLTRWFHASQGNSTDLIKNYMMVRYIFTQSPQLDPNTGSLYNAIIRGIFDGVHVNPPRWRHCLSSTTLTFGPILSRYFVLVKFGGDAKRKRVLKFLDLIHQSWQKRLQTLDWLDQPTLQMALEKLSKITQNAAYSVEDPDIRSPSSLARYYHGLTVDKHAYYKNVETSNTWFINDGWKQLVKPVDKNKFTMNSMDANAYYAPYGNQIAVSAGIMTAPFYDDRVPAYLNFGALGLVVGHEITHAFDRSGRLYNGDGALEDWWTKTTADRFTEKAQCFIKQYSNFTVTDSAGKVYHSNGNLTVGEDLADNGGFAVSRYAYQLFIANDPPKYLPGLDLTPDQLFFVNYARAWCAKATPASQVNQVLSDPHSIPKARINGVVQNSPEFAKFFSCKVDTPMNPSTKCVVW